MHQTTQIDLPHTRLTTRYLTMKHLLSFLLVFGLAFTTALAGGDDDKKKRTTYDLDRSHSSVGFSIKHLAISTVRGNFGEFTTDISMEGDDVTTLQASATIQAASIDTDNEKRDEHLRSADFFETETYPTITFTSKEVKNVDGVNFTLVGDLTMHGVTKEIELDAEILGPATLMGTQRVGFSAEGEINRKDYGLTWSRVVEAGALVVGEEVKLIIEVEAVAAE